MRLRSPLLLVVAAAIVGSTVYGMLPLIEVSKSSPSLHLWVDVKDNQLAGEVALEWAREQCVRVKATLENALQRNTDVTCAEAGTEPTEGFERRVSLLRMPDGSIRMGIRNLNVNREPTEPEGGDWTIEPAIADEQNRLIQRRLETYFNDFESAMRFHKERILMAGLPESKRVAMNQNYEYVDAETQKPIEFETAYKLYREESARQKHYLRAALEILSVLTAGEIWYWSDADFNAPDWEMKWDWKSWRKKLVTGEGWVFDDNKFDTNAYSHPKEGFAFYMFARANNLDLLQSLLLTTAGSAIWEFVCEFREKVSINDMITTPIAGMAIAEAFTQLGAFLARGSNSIVHQAFAAIFQPPRRVHNWIDRNKPKQAPYLDRYGFAADVWHRFDIFAGWEDRTAGAGGQSGPGYSFGAETHIVNVPGHEKKGDIRAILTDGNISDIFTKFTGSSDGFREFLFRTQISLVGYYEQDMNRAPEGLHGHSLFVGLGSAYEYSTYDTAEGDRDSVAIVNVIGPMVRLSYVHGDFIVRANLNVFGDFAIVNSYAIEEYKEAGGDADGLKRVLRNHDYYYYWGVTGSAGLEVEYGNLVLGANASINYYNSIEGKDRAQEQITNDAHMQEERFRTRAWIGWQWDRTLRLSFYVEQYLRWGRMDGSGTAERRDTVVGSRLDFLF